MADLPDFLDIICSEEPPGPTTEVSLVAADVGMQRQDRSQTQLRPAVNKRPARRVARYPGPKKRSKAEHSAVAARMREAKANKRALQLATDQAQTLHALVQPVRERCRGLDVQVIKPRWLGGSRRAGVKTLQLRIKGSEKHSRFTFWQRLSLAYSSSSGTNATARERQCDPHTVRRNRIAVAQSYMCMQSRIFDMASVCLQAKGDLLWSLCLLKWDETSERLSLKLVQHASLGQQRSTWTVMVVRMRFAWGWANGFSQSCEVACPVMPLTGTTAEDLHAALFQHPHMQPIMAFKKSCLSFPHRRSIYTKQTGPQETIVYTTTFCPKLHRILFVSCHFAGITKTI